MMNSLIFGGTHPAPKKELCLGAPVAAPQPERVYIPLKQHIGAPCTPLVGKGDAVRLGQKIADGEGLCVPVHASVSGTVEAVDTIDCIGGAQSVIVIRNDYQDTPDQSMIAHPEDTQVSPEALIEIIRSAGISGMGGATFPTDAKVKSALGKTDTLIVNACECEPYITADDVLMRHHAPEIVRGLRVLSRALSPEQTVIAVEDNKKEAAAALKEALKDATDIEVRILPTRYPQGAEKQLIQAVTGKEVPSGGLPMDAGCAVFNVSTVFAIDSAVFAGKPLYERIVSVTGEGVKEPANYIARIGTPFETLIEAAGGLTDNIWKVISGGPMMGVTTDALTVPVTKGTNAILCLSEKQNAESAHPTCIRCGKCVDACPIRLEPLYFYLYTEGKKCDDLQRIHISDCIECGCCAYVCPGKLPLVDRIRTGKRYVKEGLTA